MSENTDEQLLQQYSKGNNKAFETLYARYRKPVYHYFYRQVSTPASADELHQDVWLKVIKSCPQFKQQASFKTWLFKIAHNTLVDFYRSSNQRGHLQLVTETEEPGDLPILETEPLEKELQNRQIQDIILKGIESLPHEQKEVFLLHEKSGLSLEDIARITQGSFESTKSRLRYASQKLRRHLAQHLGVKQEVKL